MLSPKILRSIVLGSALLLAAVATPSFAQVDAGGAGGGGGGDGGAVQAGGFGIFANMSPEDQQALFDQFQQMQTVGQQITDNMVNAGVDPQAYFQDMFAQMQNGDFDMNVIQQQLVDKGFMTPQMQQQINGGMTKIQGTMQNVTLNYIRQQLGSTDDEWKILLPKIQRVVVAQSDVGQPGMNQFGGMGRGAGTNSLNGLGGMGGGGMMLGQAQETDAAKAYKELQTALKDPNMTEDRLGVKLRLWRELYAKAVKELRGAQDDLTSVLTLRQEAVLMNIGLL